jgi:hypothetical protein
VRVLMIPSCGDVAYMLERLEKGMWLWRQGSYDIMVLSGGVARYRYSFNPNQTYSERMYEWIMSQPGHPEEYQVIRENNSRDTYENIELSLKALQERGQVEHVTVVTQWQHGFRFASTFKRAHGIKNVRIERTSYKLPLKSWLLEWVFMFAHFVDPKGMWFLGPLNRWIRSRRPRG